MKKFFQSVKNYFDLRKRHTEPTDASLKMLRLATEFEKAAKDYDISDPYLAGKNAGRAEMCRILSNILFKND